jgi:hypothetical protein
MAVEEVGPPSTPLARRFVRHCVGFGVAVGVGLAPLLGKVPGVDALTQLLPASLQGPPLIPITAFLMGVIAVAVQFYAGEKLGRTLIRRRFKVTALVLLASLVLLFLFSKLWVVRLTLGDGVQAPPLLVGAWKPAGCCDGIQSTSRCLEELSLDPAAIESCWGRALLVSELALSFAYLTVMGSFGALIGLLLLQQEALTARSRPRRKSEDRPA